MTIFPKKKLYLQGCKFEKKILLVGEYFKRKSTVYPPTGDTNLNSNSNPNLYSKNVRLLINFVRIYSHDRNKSQITILLATV